jgi:Type I phosphodiesterase / nucleotide pyrophosphatase
VSLLQPVLPDYRGANLAGLIPALQQPVGARPAWLPEVVRGAAQVVLLVVDGLGWLQLQDRLNLAPRMAAMAGGPITSVVPSTTATALTSLTAGVAPAVHGVVGYRLVVAGPTGPEVMNVLRWKTVSGDARSFADPRSIQLVEPFGGHPVPVVSKREFAGTGFTEAHQRGMPQVGWVLASSLAVEVKRLVLAGEPLVYAYYEGIDKIAHFQGFGAYYDAELTAVDRIVGDLLDGLPEDVVLVVTADHGQVEVGPKAAVLDPRLVDRATMLSGEARFRWLHVSRDEPRAADRLAEVATDLYGDEAWIATLEQVEAEGWLGGPLRPEVRDRLGDVVIAPHEPVAYLEPDEGTEGQLACRHGSLTPDEMLVPLIARRGGRLGE